MNDRWAIVYDDGTMSICAEDASFEEAARERLIGQVFGEEARIARVRPEILSFADLGNALEPERPLET